MNRYQIQNAVRLVEGYFLPRPHEGGGGVEAFERAKAECVAVLSVQIKNIETLKQEQFFTEMKKQGKISSKSVMPREN